MTDSPKTYDELLMLVPGMTHDLGGGFVVRRLLPFRKKRMVGPFTFFDHMGPAEFAPSRETDIRPHPHIGLSTLTYLYEGRMVHRDTLGNVQTIVPGEVNWMTAGRGIAHSERAHADDYGKPTRMQGLQFWVALPDDAEDEEPSFQHLPESALPVITGDRYRATVVAGSAWGKTSPLRVSSPSIFIDVRAEAGAAVSFTAERATFEIALYVLRGRVSYFGHPIEAGQLVVLKDSTGLRFEASEDTHFVVIGGEPFTTPRLIWWNFVASTKEKIQAAQAAWKEDRFGQIAGETERIPLGE